MKVLFWNTYQNMEIDSYILDFMEENPCDIIILAEYPNSINGLCNQLSVLAMDFYPWEQIGCNTIKIVSSKTYKIKLLRDSGRYCIYRLTSLYGEMILAALHFQCKRDYSHWTIEYSAGKMKETIEEVEAGEGHRKTLIVGDFNANPFEPACINADCFHALPSRKEAKKGKRTVQGRPFSTFYNPMWNLFGDFYGAAGSYFYTRNDIHMYQWNIFDQVILRPELADSLVKESLKIVTEIKNVSLLNRNGRPKKGISDHLPIFFEIKEELLR